MSIMMCRKKEYKVGDSVTVRHCFGGYQLPTELPEGITVIVVSREIGCDRVEFNGREFTVSIACIESGWEYRLNGKWRDESDPLVLKQQRHAIEHQRVTLNGKR